ncbi:hypothetical protein [Actinoplanes sp. L3-i22]|uniref:hypothetical protein n=1 Tax=Actinoplanes sp. L3-i22 TaxID=2836373 RepID=UPI001C74B6F6|nr:hypothetical protein [Actinoplanes sp. L3-i22]BCY14704.1 hypothetical protein L3i22_097920 [Actinoplanes sp. L3-i22]
MGIDWAYDIHLPARNVATALRATAALAHPGKGPVRVTLPDGAELLLPFTSGFRADPVDVRAGDGHVQLDTLLRFPVRDDVIRAWAEGDDSAEDPIRIGYIYLSVWYRYSPRPGYAHLSYTAATTGMSHLFADSTSVRRVFTDLAASAGAVLCVLDREGDGDEICWRDGIEVAEPFDRMILAAMAARWPAAG